MGQDNAAYTPPRAPLTTQEWEIADDLGDLNCGGLGQGGALSSNSTNTRLVGKIYTQAGGNTRILTIGVYALRGQLLSSASSTSTKAATGTYTPSTTGWLALKARNTTATVPGQRCYVKVSYTAPAAVNTLTAPAPPTRWPSGPATMLQPTLPTAATGKPA